MEVSGQLQAQAVLPPRKEPLILIDSEAGWVPEPAWTLWNIEKSLAPAGNRTPAIQLVARHYTD
jgi:hypothetical protein